MEEHLFYIVSGLLLATSLLVLVTLVYVLQIIRLVMPAAKTATATEAVATEGLLVRLRKQFLTGDMRPIGQEQSIMLDHNYDGIQELDHGMPPWLAYFFYATIAFAAIYSVAFFGIDLVPTSEQEYTAEVIEAEAQVAQFKKVAAAGIDESTVKLVTDGKAIEAGKSLYSQNCQACHGAAGEGGVGPNLTDEYWLHGGTVNEVFKTIKYGVPQKGMIAWQQKLKPEEIQNVSSYILSLQGTKPANAKEPQGEPVVPQEGAADKLSMK